MKEHKIISIIFAVNNDLLESGMQFIYKKRRYQYVQAVYDDETCVYLLVVYDFKLQKYIVLNNLDDIYIEII